MQVSKFRYLDGLRGLAALVVVIDHFAISFFPAATDGDAGVYHGALEELWLRTPLHLLVSGNFAVCIFFVLSGLVLSAKFFRTGSRRSVVASASKRYFRLALPVIGSVLLVWLLLSLHMLFNLPASNYSGSNWLAQLWQLQPNLWAAFYHGTIGVFLQGRSNYNTVLWTMKTELVGSFLVFGVLLLVGRLRYRWLAYGLLAVLLVKTYYICFVAGVALADLHQHYRGQLAQWLRRGWWMPLLALSLYLGSSPVGTQRGTPFEALTGLMPHGMYVSTITHIVGAIGLVAAIACAPPVQRLLTRRPILYLGEISFSLYLTHLLVLGSLGSWLFVQLVPAIGYLPAFGLMIIPVAVFIWGVAHVFNRLVDQPTIRLSNRIPRWLGLQKDRRPAGIPDEELTNRDHAAWQRQFGTFV